MAPVLERVVRDGQHDFTTPSKKINDGDDLNFFLSSTAYKDLTIWLLQLNRSMVPTKQQTGDVQKYELTSPPTFSPAVMQLRSMLDELSDLIQKAPPHTGPRRFGNVAFRDWCRLAEEDASKLLLDRLSTTLNEYARENEFNRTAMIDELKAYLLGGFGSAQRLDYGTGHELSFLAFLGCLWKLGFFADGEERSIVIGVVQPYLHLVRNLIMTYTLEPAGSHGVWGLDDHSFLPYIFGSAQLAPAIDAQDGSAPVPTEGSLPSAPSPSIAAKKELVLDWKDSNMYFSAIHFINSVKKGPFWEHSPILYDISGIKDGWGKINKGMLKMYAAEVLGKFPVVQHFPFGSLFRWEHDPQVASQGQSVHAAQQPKSKDVPAPSVPSGTSAGTQAPWANARIGTSLPQMQSSTGVPSRRAPPSGTQRPTPPLSATPGRRPLSDRMDSVKRAFKGMFRKKKKEKPGQEQTSSVQHKAAKTETPQIANTARPDKATAEKSAQDTRVPQTQPLNAGIESRSPDGLSQTRNVDAPQAPDPNVAGGPGGYDGAKQLSDEADKAFGSGPTTGEDILQSRQFGNLGAPPQAGDSGKVDGAADAVQAAPSEAAIAAPAVTDSKPAHLTTTGEKLDPAASTIAAQHESGTANGNPTASTSNATPDIPSNPAVEPRSVPPQARHDFEDKIPVMAEPPPIRTVKAAPGMSATSGPLEDFPEGEFR
ncbi:phosphotyrosyl phosphatase activator [Hortaea werneckii]|uniref:Serine/threonine-protein phosphatase 2A activator n=1 Tax=Hortaea werneckii EXF-2000 TaxID=1157616 RepID=A0A1Z5TBQ3_HORWE|nr:phosphotyrosyl phosphatase activator [Hortaea werneckii]OTA33281.1 hypothetical protein BTJ68_06141 [Hortaea werneckii EXF-2000]KAI6852685.1 phosphotyrosyl phosphatase activator [Hortaea werneckii]KAI6944352.1 phosphotyrosyl phosphatase activator [Hortaea werneckii]KAI6951374.1 phosphotyrosyl phosphatase activator [Hortaea werneckii]